MGEEVSDYIGRLVPAMQAAYGVAWNIEARGESPKIDDRAWQVQVGYSDFQTQRNGAMGLQMTMKCAATISYVGKAPTHNSGLQAADIAVTLAAWLAGYQDFAFADNFEIQMEPVVRYREHVPENTGRYYGHVWWDVPIDAIAPDIDIAGYVTGHPADPQLPGQDLGVDIESIDVELDLP